MLFSVIVSNLIGQLHLMGHDDDLLLLLLTKGQLTDRGQVLGTFVKKKRHRLLGMKDNPPGSHLWDLRRR